MHELIFSTESSSISVWFHFLNWDNGLSAARITSSFKWLPKTSSFVSTVTTRRWRSWSWRSCASSGSTTVTPLATSALIPSWRAPIPLHWLSCQHPIRVTVLVVISVHARAYQRPQTGSNFSRVCSCALAYIKLIAEWVKSRSKLLEPNIKLFNHVQLTLTKVTWAGSANSRFFSDDFI